MANIKKIEGKTGTSYKITVTMGRDAAGKQIRHYKTWTPEKTMTARQMEKEAQKAAFEFEKELELGYQADNHQTFEQYANYVIDLKAQNGAAKNSTVTYRRFLGRIGPYIGHLKISDIRPQHLNSLYKELAKPGTKHSADTVIAKADFMDIVAEKHMSQYSFAEMCGVPRWVIQRVCHGDKIGIKPAERIAMAVGKNVSRLFEINHTVEPLSGTTIERIHSFISGVLAQAEREMLLPYNPAQKAVHPRREDYAPNYFQPEEIARILAALEKEPIMFRTIVHLFIVTGCRRGEILGLRWDKVDFENRKIKIDTSVSYLSGVGAYEGATKTKNSRFITLPDETVSLLRKYCAWHLEQKLMNGDRWNDSGFVFTQSDGAPFNPGTIYGKLDRFSKRHSLPHINPHAFRHTAASIMIANGVDIVTVSKMLGHSNTSMTTDVYSHVIEETKRKATECIADVLLRKKKA